MKNYLNAGTYGVTATGIAINTEETYRLILFVGALVLLFIQITYYIIKIKNENRRKREEGCTRPRRDKA